MGSAYQFHSWRVFVLVCAFPSVFAIGALTTQPESPRFFLEVNGARARLGEGQQGALCSNTHGGFGLWDPHRAHTPGDFILLPFSYIVSPEGLCGWRNQGTCPTMGGLRCCRWALCP